MFIARRGHNRKRISHRFVDHEQTPSPLFSLHSCHPLIFTVSVSPFRVYFKMQTKAVVLEAIFL